MVVRAPFVQFKVPVLLYSISALVKSNYFVGTNCCINDIKCYKCYKALTMPPSIVRPGLRAVWRGLVQESAGSESLQQVKVRAFEGARLRDRQGGTLPGQQGPGSGLNDLFVGVGGGCSAGSLGLCVCMCVCVR